MMDGTVAADYYAAMSCIEQQLALPEYRLKEPPSLGQLIALADALRNGSLGEGEPPLPPDPENGWQLFLFVPRNNSHPRPP